MPALKSRRPAARGKPCSKAEAAGACGGGEVAKLERAVLALRPDGLGGRLPCREEEQKSITDHVRTAVKQGGSMQVLYISGMPGTGKTASVQEVLRQLRSGKGMPPFVVAHVNAMRLGTPGAIFRELRNQLPWCGGQSSAVSLAHGELTEVFSQRSAEDPVIVLMIDEVDQLATRNQAVLYRVFDWLALPNPRLVVVAISNIMDLPERLLPRVASRFSIVRVDFEAYSKDQIHQILCERLAAHNADGAFSATALKLCSARVAAGAGDVRKALQLCRRAVEVRLGCSDASGPSDVVHLAAAERELLHANPATESITGLSVKARRFLLALLLELRRKEAEVAPLHRVASRYAKLLAGSEQAEPHGLHHAPEAQFLAERLEAMALLVRQGWTGRGPAGAVQALALGAGLDTEDLAGALEAAEDDEGIRELLRAERW